VVGLGVYKNELGYGDGVLKVIKHVNFSNSTKLRYFPLAYFLTEMNLEEQ
jgi:hypothetical protein